MGNLYKIYLNLNVKTNINLKKNYILNLKNDI